MIVIIMIDIIISQYHNVLTTPYLQQRTYHLRIRHLPRNRQNHRTHPLQLSATARYIEGQVNDKTCKLKMRIK